MVSISINAWMAINIAILIGDYITYKWLKNKSLFSDLFE